MNADSPRLSFVKANRLGLAVLALALGIFGWATTRGWSLPLTDSHSSRQAQTAITAQMLYRGGNDTVTPFNGLGAPWSVPMEFPTYQLATAAAAHLTGGNIVSAGRLVSIFGALALLPALWLLLGRANLSPTQRCFTLALLLAAPLYAHYSRAVLIETWATAIAFWWLAAFVEGLCRPTTDRRWLTAAITLGVLAALTKVTSFAVVLAPAAFVTLVRLRQRQSDRAATATVAARALLATFPGILAAVAWTRYSDAVKAAHPYADFLTSAALHDWNWGTLAQRLDPAWWQRWFYHLQLIVPAWALVLPLIALIWGNARQRLVLAAALLTAVSGPLAFANLYFVHDYYYMAVVPAVIVALGLGLVVLQRLASDRPVMAIAALIVLGFQAHDYAIGLGRGQMRNRPTPHLAQLIHELTSPDDVVAVFGREWDPLVTFYADRPMASIRGTHEANEDAWIASRAVLAPQTFTVLVALDSIAGDTAFIDHRCRELGLAPEPLASTADADIYVRPDARERLAPLIAQLRQSGQLLPARPDRMGPGETRLEFITADWQPLSVADANRLFAACQPFPDETFHRHDPTPMQVADQTVLLLHPPAGLRFNALSRPRLVTLRFGLMPEIWEKERDSDGVRFSAYLRAPGQRLREIWEHVVQPRKITSDRGPQTATFTLPAGASLELRIDAGPDHNPGYDWSYLESVRLDLVP